MTSPLKWRNSFGRDISILCEEWREPESKLQPASELQSRETLPEPQFRASFSEPQPREPLSELYFRESSSELHAQEPPSRPLPREPLPQEPRPRSHRVYPPPTNRFHPYQDDAAPACNRAPLPSPAPSPAPPPTPGLVRSVSYDSIQSHPLSPITPREAPDYGYAITRNSSFSSITSTITVYRYLTQFEHGARSPRYPKHPSKPSPHYPAAPAPRRRSAYDNAALAEFNASPNHHLPTISDAYSPPHAKPIKAPGGPTRYRCRYALMIGCKKTFTTSGHASRHSKIHTAEKMIQCTNPGCVKTFTRADNMKQHLETHFKSRRSGSGAGKAVRGPSGWGAREA